MYGEGREHREKKLEAIQEIDNIVHPLSKRMSSSFERVLRFRHFSLSLALYLSLSANSEVVTRVEFKAMKTSISKFKGKSSM